VQTPLPAALMPRGRRAGLKAAVGIVVGATVAAVMGALTLGAGAGLRAGARAVAGMRAGWLRWQGCGLGGLLRRMSWGCRRRGTW